MIRSDIDIAKDAKMLKIKEIASNLGLNEDDYQSIGHFKAKIRADLINDMKDKKDGKLVLVTAINPTPAGEGKTTTSVGLLDGLCSLGINAGAALREPSLGPVFGMKGGAAGGGYAQVVPMEDLNLHFTGDMHAITSANNLLAALMDNHIYQGNELNIDIENITWRRCMDMNERQLRNIVSGLGKNSGVERKDGFDITAASEVMAAFCLASDLVDLKSRLGNIIVAMNMDKKPVYAKDLNAQGAMCALLRDAFDPNIVQTMENNPVFIHGGPFANIAHGCNSIIATQTALKLCDVVVTEAGFGADLGAEKFMDIKCRCAGFAPDVVVLVATIRALKYHGGVAREDLGEENVEAVEKGLTNLEKHIENMKYGFSRNVVVALNHFVTDTEAESAQVYELCKSLNIPLSFSTVWSNGGEGGKDLAKTVMELLDKPSVDMPYLYDEKESIEDKITAVAKYYGANNVEFTKRAKEDINNIITLGLDKLPVCIAKTQYSLSDKAKLLGRPKDFTIKVRRVNLNNGAGFLVVLTGRILRMPGLPKIPSANAIDIDTQGNIKGLF